ASLRWRSSGLRPVAATPVRNDSYFRVSATLMILQFLIRSLERMVFGMKTVKVLHISCAGLLLLVCSLMVKAQTVRYNSLPGTDFSKYKTYKWARIPNAKYPNQILDEQIMRSIDGQLATKGLSRTEDNPDLIVVYQAAVDHEKQWDSYSTGGGTWGWGGWGG